MVISGEGCIKFTVTGGNGAQTASGHLNRGRKILRNSASIRDKNSPIAEIRRALPLPNKKAQTEGQQLTHHVWGGLRTFPVDRGHVGVASPNSLVGRVPGATSSGQGRAVRIRQEGRKAGITCMAG